MNIEDFGSEDVFVNVHGYRRWDKGRIREPVENIAEVFPGKVFGVTEEDCGGAIYGREEMDLIIESDSESGNFRRSGLGIEDAEKVVIAGGEYQRCHFTAYDNFRLEVDDAEFIFPPEACFGWYEHPEDKYNVYRLDEFYTGTHPVGDEETVKARIMDEIKEFDAYDWSTSSIQSIEL